MLVSCTLYCLFFVVCQFVINKTWSPSSKITSIWQSGTRSLGEARHSLVLVRAARAFARLHRLGSLILTLCGHLVRRLAPVRIQTAPLRAAQAFGAFHYWQQCGALKKIAQSERSLRRMHRLNHKWLNKALRFVSTDR